MKNHKKMNLIRKFETNDCMSIKKRFFLHVCGAVIVKADRNRFIEEERKKERCSKKRNKKNCRRIFSTLLNYWFSNICNTGDTTTKKCKKEIFKNSKKKKTGRHKDYAFE